MTNGNDRVLTGLVAVVWACVVALGLAYVLARGENPPVAEASGTPLSVTSTTTSARSNATRVTGHDSVAATAGMTAAKQAASGRITAQQAATTTSTTAARGPLTVAAGGDVIGDRQVGVYIDEQGGDAALSRVAPLLQDAQVAFVNLESPLSDQGSQNTTKDVTFRGRPALVGGLASAGVDVVSVANNHALDWGADALLDTIERLDRAGVAHAGAGADLAAARAPALIDTPAGAVALLAYTNVIPEGFPAGPDRPGVNPLRPDRERVLADIAAAAERYPWVIVSLHWGIEYQGRPEHEQRVFAHDAVDAGANMVLGHHPHVLQGMEIYRDKLIAYSLGDFVFDHYSRETGEAFVLQASLNPAGPPSLRVTPVYLSEAHGIPRVVTDDEADRILDRVEQFSGELGLALFRDGDSSAFSVR